MHVGLLARLTPLLLLCNTAEARPKAANVGGGAVPELEATLVAAGWTMTPERPSSYNVGDIYSRSTNTPVAFKAKCFDAEPRENVYTSLAVVQAMKAGARVPLGVTRFKAEGMEYKQLKFAEPYMTELADMDLVPKEKCHNFLASRSDLADLFVIKAVLSAEVKEQLCRTMDGAVGALGFGASAEAQQECVQESEGHVAVAYKIQPAASLVSLTAAPAASPAVPAARASVAVAAPSQATASVDLGGASGGLGVAERLRQQRCDETAKVKGEKARAVRLGTAEQGAQSKARAAWSGQSAELEMCASLKRAERDGCIAAVNAWLGVARAMVVSIPAGVETIETECGTRQPVFEGVERTVVASDVKAAEVLLSRLRSADVVRDSFQGLPAIYNFSTHQPGAAPGYNCAKATKTDEHIICSHVDLARLDKEMSTLYFSLKKQATGIPVKAFKQSQIDWLRERGSCGTYECVKKLMEARILYFGKLQRINSGY